MKKLIIITLLLVMILSNESFARRAYIIYDSTGNVTYQGSWLDETFDWNMKCIDYNYKPYNGGQFIMEVPFVPYEDSETMLSINYSNQRVINGRFVNISYHCGQPKKYQSTDDGWFSKLWTKFVNYLTHYSNNISTQRMD